MAHVSSFLVDFFPLKIVTYSLLLVEFMSRKICLKVHMCEISDETDKFLFNYCNLFCGALFIQSQDTVHCSCNSIGTSNSGSSTPCLKKNGAHILEYQYYVKFAVNNEL